MLNKKQAADLKVALMQGGFLVTHHGKANGFLSTRLDLPNVVAVVITTEDGIRFDVHHHWRRARLPRALRGSAPKGGR